MTALKLILPSLALMTALTVEAQQAYNPAQARVDCSADKDLHKTTENVEWTIKVINYGNRSGITKVDIGGASLLPDARAKARVEQKQGRIEIEADFYGLQAATRFGPEYLTYVLWAITPEGSAANLGEVVMNDMMKSKLNATTELQFFGLIVTAEPYFAVSQPSDVVVMENVFITDSAGNERVEAKYELLPRGSYTANVSRSELKPIVVDRSTPLHLYEARNALWIALWAGADKEAAGLFAKAERSLQRAEAFHASGAGEKPVLIAARETVQTAENARAAALRRRPSNRVSQGKPAVRSSAIGA